MGTRTVRWGLGLALLVAARTAAGGDPSVESSTVPNVLVSPDGTLEYRIFVAGRDGPVDSALVQLSFSPEATRLLCWCMGQTKPLIEATTNAAGLASFFIAGGGCLDPDSTSTPPVQVIVDGELLKTVGVVSPDAVDGDGFLPTQGWNPGLLCAAGLSDAAKHTHAISSGTYEFCTDVDGDLDCDLDDAVTLTPILAAGVACTRAP